MNEAADATRAPETKPAPEPPAAQPDTDAGRPAPAGAVRIPGLAWPAIALGGAALLFYLLAPILTPFALAGVMAYVLLPGVAWLERRGLPRAPASVLMVLASGALILGLLLVLLPVLEREILALSARLPALLAQANAYLAPLVHQWLGVWVKLDASALRSMALQEVGQQDLAAYLLARFGSGGLALVQLLGTLALVPIVLFYLLLDAREFGGRFEAALPRRWSAQVMEFLGEIDGVLAQFLRGQLTVMLALAVYYSSALAIAGFDSALSIGLLTGLLIFIPYVGFALGLLLALLAAVLQFGTWTAALAVLGIYAGGQVLEGFFLTPRLVGKRIGLHPLAVIFALLAFGQVFGFFGVLVALPSSAVLLVGLRRLRRRYLASDFYRRD